jgi:hypothetical protein
MTQANDLGQIANQARTLYRGRVNAGFQALATGNEGSSAPSQTYPFMRWRNDGAGLIYERNAADNGWTIVQNYAATADPTTGDDSADGYVRGALWINVGANKAFLCTNPAAGAAVWAPLSFSAFMQTLLAATSAEAARTTLGVGALLRAKAPPAIANNASDANNDIDIAAGACSSDEGPILTLAATLTKRLDASWAVGTGNGGLDTGAKANSTWYAVWLIARSDTGVVDALFSLSATAPTMPAGYDRKRRLGWVRTDGSGNIRGFTHTGDLFELTARILDVNNNSLSTSVATYTLTVPPGLVGMLASRVGNNGFVRVAIWPADIADMASSDASCVYTSTNSTGGQGSSQVFMRVSSASQVKCRLDAGTAVPFILGTHGWIDRRGRDD